MKNTYPNEKFSSAIDCLATSPKSIQERICDAYIFNLIHVKPNEVPPEIRLDFEQLSATLTSAEPKGDEGSAAATTSRMSDDEAIGIAKKILQIAHIIRHDLENP